MASLLKRATMTFWKLLSFLCALSLLTACSIFQPQGSQKEPLRVEYTDWWGDYTMIIAEEQGLFEKYGVDVDAQYYETFSNAIPDLAAGKIDAGLLAIGDAINISRHTPVKVVTVYDNGGMNTVVSVPEIKSVSDLQGKRIGVPIGTTYELVISEMLKEAGLSISDVTLVNVVPEDITERLSQDIQAGFVYEPYTSEALQNGNKLIYSSDVNTGLFPDVITFREQVATERPEDVKKFLQAWFEAVEFRKNNPEKANQIIAKRLGKPVEEIVPDAEIKILDNAENQAIFAPQNNLGFRPISQTFLLNSSFLVRIGTLSKIPAIQQFLDPSYLE